MEKQHEYNTINEASDITFVQQMNLAESKGWRMVCSNSSVGPATDEFPESYYWTAILKRPVTYVEERIADLKAKINNFDHSIINQSQLHESMGKEEVDNRNRDIKHLTELKAEYEAEIKLLQESS